MRSYSIENCTMTRAPHNRSFDGLLDRITNVVYAKPGSQVHERLGLAGGADKMAGSKVKSTKNTHPAFSQRSKSATMLNISATLTSDFSEVEVRKMKSSEGLNEMVDIPQSMHRRTVAVLVEHCNDSDACQSDSSVDDFETAGPNRNYSKDSATKPEIEKQARRPLSLTLESGAKSAFIVSRASQTSITSDIDTQLLESSNRYKPHDRNSIAKRSSLIPEATVGLVPRSTPTLVWKDDVVMNDKVVDFTVMDPAEKAALKKRMKAKFVRKHNSPRVRQANKSFLLHYAKVKV